MKRKLQLRGAVVALASVLFTSCGAIIGGSNYYAHITVDNMEKAQIYYNGELQGTGYAALKLKRKDANNLVFTVKEEGGKEEKFEYKSRIFRGWALAGSILTFTGSIGPIPLPFGVGVDLAAGTLWKPDVNEKGVVKIDYKNYAYHLEMPGIIPVPENIENLITTVDYIYTKDGSIIIGQIIEEEANVFIKVKTKDFGIKTVNFAEVDIVKRGVVQQQM